MIVWLSYLKYIIKIYKYIKRLIKNELSDTPSKVETEEIDTDTTDDNSSVVQVNKFSNIKLKDVSDVTYLAEDSDNNLLIMDDVAITMSLYKISFKNMTRDHFYNIIDHVTIATALGSNAGLVAYKYLLEHEINFAIIDITIGQIVYTDDNSIIEIDGIDIAIEIWNRYPKAKIVFVTAHSLNRDNKKLNYYFNKFEEMTGKKIENYYINKNDLNRTKLLYEFLTSKEGQYEK